MNSSPDFKYTLFLVPICPHTHLLPSVVSLPPIDGNGMLPYFLEEVRGFSSTGEGANCPSRSIMLHKALNYRWKTMTR